MGDVIVFKKYANRRIYNTETSAYVTLQQVGDEIREGRHVKVLDAKTKQDVTAFILTQIILEEAKNKNVLLPAPLLHMIIQFGDNLLVDFFEQYLQQIIQSYITHKAVYEQQFKQWVGMGMNLTGMTDKNGANAGDLYSMFNLNPFLKPATSRDEEDKSLEEKEK